MPDVKPIAFMKNHFTETFCDIFNCSNRCDWTIRRKDTNNPETFNLCEAHVVSLLGNIPDEISQDPQPEQEEAEAQQEEAPAQQNLNEDQISERMTEKLEELTVDQLREMAQELEIDKYYNMRKDELVKALSVSLTAKQKENEENE